VIDAFPGPIKAGRTATAKRADSWTQAVLLKVWPVIVEATTDLAPPVWTPVSTNTLAGGTAYFSDPQWQSYPSRLYRLRTP
jgi:hypothetical protein